MAMSVKNLGHFITKCKVCQDVISQCRCFNPDKEVYYGVCDKCKVPGDARAVAEDNYPFGGSDY